MELGVFYWKKSECVLQLDARLCVCWICSAHFLSMSVTYSLLSYVGLVLVKGHLNIIIAMRKVERPFDSYY